MLVKEGRQKGIGCKLGTAHQIVKEEHGRIVVEVEVELLASVVVPGNHLVPPV